MARHCRHCGDEKFVENPRLLWFAFSITFVFFVVELVGGYWTNSFALISDSLHMAMDALALLMGALASFLAGRFSDHTIKIKSSAAFLNAIFLLILSVIVAKEAYERLFIPREILSLPMLAIAIVGLGVNAFEEKLLRHQAHHDLNTRGAYIHIIGDYASSIGVIAAACIIFIWGWTPADTLAAFLVAILMFITGIQVLRESVLQLRRT